MVAVIKWWYPSVLDDFKNSRCKWYTGNWPAMECYAMTTLRSGSTDITVMNIHPRLGNDAGVFRMQEGELRSNSSGNSSLLESFAVAVVIWWPCLRLEPCLFRLPRPVGYRSRSKHMSYCRDHAGCMRERDDADGLQHWWIRT